MAGRRSKKFLEEMTASQPSIVAVDDVVADEGAELSEPVAVAPVAVSGPVEVAAPVDREAELEAEVERLKAVNAALVATAKEKPVIEGWPESVVPRTLAANYTGEFVVNPTGARGVMVLEGTLYVRAPSSSTPTRLMPGGYALLAKGQPHALETGPAPVRAVFVESAGYEANLQKYQPAEPVLAIPSATSAQSWADSPASVHAAANPDFAPAVSRAPAIVVTQSKAVTQLLEMQRHRGRRGFEVRHPNERTPSPASAGSASITPGAVASPSPGFNSNGAPIIVADGASGVFTGDGIVR